MSVLSVELIDRNSKMDTAGDKTASRIYLVTCDDRVTDDEMVVLTAPGLPEKYSNHPSDEDIWADSFDVAPYEDRLHWKVSVNYAMKPGNTPSDAEHPCDLPSVVSFFTENEKLAMKRSYKLATDPGAPNPDVRYFPTKAIVNSAGDPFTEPAQVDTPKLGIRIQRNWRNSSVDPLELSTYVNTRNIAKITVGGIAIDPYVGKMKDIKCDPQRDAFKELYWSVTCEIVLDTDLKWDYKVVDQGFNAKKSLSDDAPVRARPSGEKATTPLLLDGFGLLLNGTGRPGEPPLAPAFYLSFHILWSMDWLPLDLTTNQDGRH